MKQGLKQVIGLAQRFSLPRPQVFVPRYLMDEVSLEAHSKPSPAARGAKGAAIGEGRHDSDSG